MTSPSIAEDYVQQCEEMRTKIFKGYEDIGKLWEAWSKSDGIAQDMFEQTIEGAKSDILFDAQIYNFVCKGE